MSIHPLQCGRCRPTVARRRRRKREGSAPNDQRSSSRSGRPDRVMSAIRSTRCFPLASPIMPRHHAIQTQVKCKLRAVLHVVPKRMALLQDKSGCPTPPFDATMVLYASTQLILPTGTGWRTSPLPSFVIRYPSSTKVDLNVSLSISLLLRLVAMHLRQCSNSSSSSSSSRWHQEWQAASLLLGQLFHATHLQRSASHVSPSGRLRRT